MARPMFRGAESYKHLEKLTVGIGPRYGGTEAETEAAKYIKKVFSSYGLETQLQPFEVRGYEQKEARLTVSGLGEIPCESLGLMKNTRAQGVEAPIAFLESGDEAYVSPKLAGKIVMVSGALGGEAYEALVKVKPAGLIYIEDRVAVGPMRVEMMPERRDKVGAVPAVRVAYEDGLKILKSGKKKAHLKVQAHEWDATSHNVLGELVGSEKPDEIIVIGGHYDSIRGGAGTQDNAGGTVIVMELARVFAQKGSKRTLRFMAFGSEEKGLRGSIHYRKLLKDEDKKLKKKKDFESKGGKSTLDKHRLMINVDVQGAILGRNACFVLGPADLAASVRLLSAEMGPAFTMNEKDVYSSDNAPLGDVGVPSVSFGRAGAATTFGHTDGDVIDHTDAERLALTGRFIETWMERWVTHCPKFPFERMIQDDQKTAIDRYFKDRLRLQFEDEEEEEKKPRRKRM